MASSKRIIFLAMLLICVMPLTVSAAARTIDGTKYRTTYDPGQIKNVFGAVTESIDSNGKLSGEIVLLDLKEYQGEICKQLKASNPLYIEYYEDTILERDEEITKISCRVPDTFYGVVAGDIKVTLPGTVNGKITVKKNGKNEALYYNLFNADGYKQANKDPYISQWLKADELLVTKNPAGKIVASKHATVKSKKGGTYFQERIAVCTDCQFELNSRLYSMSIEGEATAMPLDTYRNKYKGKTEEQRQKIDEWEAVRLSDLKWVYFYPHNAKLRFSGDNTIELISEMHFRAYPSKEVKGSVNGIYLQSPSASLRPVQVAVALPSEETFSRPVYYIGGSAVGISEIPDETLVFIDYESKQSPQFSVMAGENTLLTSKDKITMLAINKDTNSASSETDCPKIFRNYNCLVLSSATAYFKPAKEKQLYSPIDGKLKRAGINLEMSANDYTSVLSDSFYGKDASLKLFRLNQFGEIEILYDKVNMPKFSVGGKPFRWYDLGVSFTSSFVNEITGEKDTMSCYHFLKKCTINGASVIETGLDNPETEITYMTYNIAHGRGNEPLLEYPSETARDFQLVCSKDKLTRQLDMIADFVKKNNIDVLSLNEVDFSDTTWSYQVDIAQYLADKLGYYKYTVRGLKWRYTDELYDGFLNEKKDNNPIPLIVKLFKDCPGYYNQYIWKSLPKAQVSTPAILANINPLLAYSRVEQGEKDIDPLFRTYYDNSGNAIISKYPIIRATNKVYDHEPADRKNAGYGTSYMDVDILVGKTKMRVINTHLNDDPSLSKIEITELITATKSSPTPLVISGDFNLDYRHPQHKPALDQLFANGYTALPMKDYTYPYYDPVYKMEKMRLDHIFVKGDDIKLGDSKVIPSTLSDHYPIITKIKLRAKNYLQ